NTNTQLTSTLTVPSTAMITLKANLYLNPGAILTAAIAWERSVTVDKAFWWWETTTYTSNTMANYDLYISSAYSNVLYTTCNSSNNEMVRYTVISPGYYSIKLQPRSNYASATGNYLNYSYSVN
ncbi:MAG: hypothetical protein NTV44_01805, partial [Firmicutes bacterium]|nr:hypothetical protein [Bacillota bacterium]